LAFIAKKSGEIAAIYVCRGFRSSAAPGQRLGLAIAGQPSANSHFCALG
jgi:hypothetical protein